MASANYEQPYYPVFGLVKDYDALGIHRWFSENYHLGHVQALVYIVAVFAGERFMRNREKYNLRTPLFLWSAGLAIFSILGAISTTKGLIWDLTNYGLRYTVCNTDYFANKGAAFWGTLFVVSKGVEFGDTAFIILRKNPLIFLHWYHHALTCIMAWWGYGTMESIVRWYMTMNYVVHSIMYSYYALKALQIRIPKLVSLSITALQIVQMIIGVFVISKTYVYRLTSSSCLCTEFYLQASLLMYGSYFLLFGLFFVKAYLRKPAAKNKENGIKHDINSNGSDIGLKKLK